jgi:hypothetical protein
VLKISLGYNLSDGDATYLPIATQPMLSGAALSADPSPTQSWRAECSPVARCDLVLNMIETAVEYKFRPNITMSFGLRL